MATKPSHEQLVELYNAANPGLATPLTVDDVDFAAPAAAAEGAEKNTTLVITAKGSSANFSGSKELSYTRVTFAPGATPVTDDKANWDTDAKVLAHFNALLQETRPEDEFAESEVTISSAANAEDATKEDVTVAINAGHAKFLPGEAVVWTISQAKSDLANTNGDLDGFE